MISPEMLSHVLILHNGKEFVFNRSCSFDLKSIAGLIAGGREGRETRHTVFFTPLPKMTRKVHYKTGWKYSQDAVYWIHLGRAQEKGTAFWATQIACNHHRQHGAT